ncbi:MAG: efflux RND transporter periplasmic adaptor subunit [Saprospiraceae bacterium]|nr:efflux RND transporter periplasmic adaptor subunit [Saprospiraceae bacterium]
MKIGKIILTTLIVLALAAFATAKLYNNKKIIDEKAAQREVLVSSIPVRVALVEKIIKDNSLNLTGSFEARKELGIIAETQGRLTNLYLDEGSTIRKGQIVAKVDDTGIQSQLATAEASLSKAEKDVERFERLLKAGAVSQLQLEEMKLNKQNMETNVTAVEQQLKYTVINSPMTGTVKEVKVEEGSFATPGAIIATVVDISSLKMVVKVPEVDIIKVEKGQAVEIQTEVYPDKIFTGHVNLISVQADQGRKFDVEIDLPNNASFPLKAGMYGSVKIQPTGPQSNEESLYVPRNAVIGSIKDAKVYIVLADDTVSLKSIEVGDEDNDKIEVLSGLNEGETVVTTGQINLSEGKSIKILSDKIL